MSNGFLSVNTSFGITGITSAANSIYVTKLTAISDATATAVLINSASNFSSISFKVVIYDAAHSVLLATGSTVTSLVAGYNRLALTSDLALTAGTAYYVGYVCANSLSIGGNFVQTINPSWFVSGSQSVSSPANPLSGGSSNNSALIVGLEFSGSNQGFGWGPDGTVIPANLVVSNEWALLTTAADQGVRSLVTHSTATPVKAYAEVQVFGTLNISEGVGLVAACLGMALASSNNNFCEVWDLTFGETAGTTIVGILSFNSGVQHGDTICIAYDSSTDKVWFRFNNGVWWGNGGTPDPATGTSGLPVGSHNWPLAVFAGTIRSGVAPQFILRDTANVIVYPMPSGYSAWSPATGVPIVFASPIGAEASAQAGGVIVAPKLGMSQFTTRYLFASTAILFDGVLPTMGDLTGVTATVSVEPVRTQIVNQTPSPSGLSVTYSPDDFTKALLDLLPHGRVWPKYPSSNLSQTVAALIGSYARFPGSAVGDNASSLGSSNRASDLLLDTMIAWNELSSGAVIELLPEWQITLGLPDPCLSETASIEQQVRQCVARFLAVGGQSILFITQFAAALGFAITVNEFVGFRPDIDTTDSELRDEWAVFLWEVTSADDGNWLFETDLNMADEALGGFGNTVLECEIRRVAPAHTLPYFATVADLPLLGVEAIIEVGTLTTG